jgi:hypothetical protein
MEKANCKIWVESRNYGSVEDENDTYTTGIYSLVDLYLQAIRRNIDIDLGEEKICELIKDQTPSLKWQRRILIEISDKNIVTEDELEIMHSYRDTGYIHMNVGLRRNPTGKALINDIISRLSPLPNDIVVFRYVKKYKYLPTDIGKIFTSQGYLSTTMDAAMTTGAICDNIINGEFIKDGAIMQINVPAGARAIYLSGDEKELLFPHNTQLKLINYTKGKFICEPINYTCVIVNDVPFFTFEMVLKK